MNGRMRRTARHRIILATASLALCIVIIGFLYRLFSTVSSPIEGNPRVGSAQAKISLILVEDFRCGACKRFSQTIFPQIQAQYLDTGAASLVFVPIAFLPDSEPLANAAIAVYHFNPEKYVEFMHALFEAFASHGTNPSMESDLISVASRVGGIDLKKLQECIDSNCYKGQLEQNLAWVKETMGEHFFAPALFINGVSASTGSFDKISRKMERLRSGS